MRLGPRNDARAALWIISASRGRIAKRVRAIKCIIERTPTGVRRIQGIPRVCDRNDKLRARDFRDLGINVGGCDLKGRRLGHEVADVAQERLIRCSVMGRTSARAMPVIDFRLKVRPLLEQCGVYRRSPSDKIGKRRPNRTGIQSGARQCFVFDEVGKFLCNLKSAAIQSIRHGCLFLLNVAPNCST